jgi:hypothetical protein
MEVHVQSPLIAGCSICQEPVGKSVTAGGAPPADIEASQAGANR